MIGETISLDALIEGGMEVASKEMSIDELMQGKFNLDHILLLLTPRQQLIVLLKMVGYDKNREVAGIIDMSISTVEKELIKIRQRLSSFKKTV